MRVWTTAVFGVALESNDRRRLINSWHSCGAKGGGAGLAEGRRQSDKQVS